MQAYHDVDIVNADLLYQAIEDNELAVILNHLELIHYPYSKSYPSPYLFTSDEAKTDIDNPQYNFKMSLQQWNPLLHACFKHHYAIVVYLLRQYKEHGIALDEQHKKAILVFAFNELCQNNNNHNEIEQIFTLILPDNRHYTTVSHYISDYIDFDIESIFTHYKYYDNHFMLAAIKIGLLTGTEYLSIAHVKNDYGRIFEFAIRQLIDYQQNNPDISQEHIGLLFYSYELQLQLFGKQFTELPKELIEALESKFIDINAKNSNHETLYSLAVKYHNPKLAQLLINLGAKIQLQDNPQPEINENNETAASKLKKLNASKLVLTIVACIALIAVIVICYLLPAAALFIFSATLAVTAIAMASTPLTKQINSYQIFGMPQAAASDNDVTNDKQIHSYNTNLMTLRSNKATMSDKPSTIHQPQPSLASNSNTLLNIRFRPNLNFNQNNKLNKATISPPAKTKR